MKPDTAPRLSAHNISVTRGRRTIVHDASLTLNTGELTVLAGPNGAGKTTLARAMAGVLACDGAVTFDGQDFSAMTPRARARALAYLPQGHQFHWPMSVRSIVALGREPHADPFSQQSATDRAAIQRAVDTERRPMPSTRSGQGGASSSAGPCSETRLAPSSAFGTRRKALCESDSSRVGQPRSAASARSWPWDSPSACSSKTSSAPRRRRSSA